MAALVFIMLVLAMTGGSDAAWCVCRPDVSDPVLQKTLDYACGAGADCNAILQSGPCYNPNSVRAHCSYAANSYYQRKGQAQGSCDFASTAILTNSDPSSSGCSYPASSSAGLSTTPPTTTNPGSTATNPGSTVTNPGSTTPSTFAPPTGTGGVLGGLGPSGNTISTDGASLSSAGMASLVLSIMFSCLALLRG